MILLSDEFVDLRTSTGTMRTHLFRPEAKGSYPCLVFWSEIFQVTGPIRRMAAFLAGHGFVVAVPEIYHEYEQPGVALAYDEVGSNRGNTLKTTKPIAAYDSDAQTAVEFLKTYEHGNGKVGTLGVCIGGHLAFRAAFHPDVLASACFYATDIHKRSLGEGMNDDSLDRCGEIAGELMMIWGRQDPHIPREGRRVIYEALSDADLDFQWFEFNGAHAFMRDEGPRYNPVLAQQCFTLAIELFKRKLN